MAHILYLLTSEVKCDVEKASSVLSVHCFSSKTTFGRRATQSKSWDLQKPWLASWISPKAIKPRMQPTSPLRLFLPALFWQIMWTHTEKAAGLQVRLDWFCQVFCLFCTDSDEKPLKAMRVSLFVVRSWPWAPQFQSVSLKADTNSFCFQTHDGKWSATVQYYVNWLFLKLIWFMKRLWFLVLIGWDKSPINTHYWLQNWQKRLRFGAAQKLRKSFPVLILRVNIVCVRSLTVKTHVKRIRSAHGACKCACHLCTSALFLTERKPLQVSV